MRFSLSLYYEIHGRLVFPVTEQLGIFTWYLPLHAKEASYPAHSRIIEDLDLSAASDPAARETQSFLTGQCNKWKGFVLFITATSPPKKITKNVSGFFENSFSR